MHNWSATKLATDRNISSSTEDLNSVAIVMAKNLRLTHDLAHDLEAPPIGGYRCVGMPPIAVPRHCTRYPSYPVCPDQAGKGL